MAKFTNIKIFNVPIYESKVCFVKYDSELSFKRAIDKLTRQGAELSEVNNDAYMLSYGFVLKSHIGREHVFFIFMNNAKEYRDSYFNTLAHENYHLVNYICSHNEIINTSDNEPVAYLTGYLFDRLAKF